MAVGAECQCLAHPVQECLRKEARNYLNGKRKQKLREKRKLRAKRREERKRSNSQKSRMILMTMNESGWLSVIRGFSLYQFLIN
jgi:hypothetical protein